MLLTFVRGQQIYYYYIYIILSSNKLYNQSELYCKSLIKTIADENDRNEVKLYNSIDTLNKEYGTWSNARGQEIMKAYRATPGNWHPEQPVVKRECACFSVFMWPVICQ